MYEPLCINNVCIIYSSVSFFLKTILFQSKSSLSSWSHRKKLTQKKQPPLLFKNRQPPELDCKQHFAYFLMAKKFSNSPVELGCVFNNLKHEILHGYFYYVKEKRLKLFYVFYSMLMMYSRWPMTCMLSFCGVYILSQDLYESFLLVNQFSVQQKLVTLTDILHYSFSWHHLWFTSPKIVDLPHDK